MSFSLTNDARTSFSLFLCFFFAWVLVIEVSTITWFSFFNVGFLVTTTSLAWLANVKLGSNYCHLHCKSYFHPFFHWHCMSFTTFFSLSLTSIVWTFLYLSIINTPRAWDLFPFLPFSHITTIFFYLFFIDILGAWKLFFSLFLTNTTRASFCFFLTNTLGAWKLFFPSLSMRQALSFLFFHWCCRSFTTSFFLSFTTSAIKAFFYLFLTNNSRTLKLLPLSLDNIVVGVSIFKVFISFFLISVAGVYLSFFLTNIIGIGKAWPFPSFFSFVFSFCTHLSLSLAIITT